MLLRSLTKHVKDQNWFAVVLDFLIVVAGVYIGIQVANWNGERIESERRTQIVDSLITNLDDSNNFQFDFIRVIEAGISQWGEAYTRGERPVPYYYRIQGSDSAPDVWSTFENMQLADMFDPVTLFDLTFYYSELEGISQKYIRYISFVEQKVLPGVIVGRDFFYAEGGVIKPEFQANMDRLSDFAEESKMSAKWAECLVYRLRTERKFEQTCRRANYILEGMKPSYKPTGISE